MENFRGKEFYREKIIKLLVQIDDVDILEYLYKMTVDIAKEDKMKDAEK